MKYLIIFSVITLLSLGLSACKDEESDAKAVSESTSGTIFSDGKMGVDFSDDVQVRSDGSVGVDISDDIQVNSDGTLGISLGDGVQMRTDGTVGFDFGF